MNARRGPWGSGAVGVIIAGCVALLACEKEATPADDGSSGSSGQFVPPGTGPKYTVECTHPGAGAMTAGGRCECDVTLTIAGTFNGLFTCREGTACVEKDKAESFRFKQDGNSLTGEEGPEGAPTFKFSGTICKDLFTWKGGPTDGMYEECGTLRFLDANHYVKDSCYKNGGGCVPSFTIGCPDMTGQCTNTGSKAPEAAATIVKMICN